MDALDRSDGSLKVDANITTYILGRNAMCTGDTVSARRQFEANLAQWRATGDARSRPGVGALVGLSLRGCDGGAPDSGARVARQALVLSERLGSGAALAYTLEGYAILAVAANRPEQAVRLAGAAAALRASLHHPISPAERELLERWLGWPVASSAKRRRSGSGGRGRRFRRSRRSGASAVLKT